MFVLHLDVSFFSESLEKYNNEHEQAVGILEHRSIGMILVDCKKLKEVLIPSPLKCLEVRRAMVLTACLQSFLSAKGMRNLAPARVSYRDNFLISYRVYTMTGSFHISLFEDTIHVDKIYV